MLFVRLIRCDFSDVFTPVFLFFFTCDYAILYHTNPVPRVFWLFGERGPVYKKGHIIEIELSFNHLVEGGRLTGACLMEVQFKCFV